MDLHVPPKYISTGAPGLFRGLRGLTLGGWASKVRICTGQIRAHREEQAGRPWDKTEAAASSHSRLPAIVNVHPAFVSANAYPARSTQRRSDPCGGSAFMLYACLWHGLLLLLSAPPTPLCKQHLPQTTQCVLWAPFGSRKYQRSRFPVEMIVFAVVLNRSIISLLTFSSNSVLLCWAGPR